MPRLCRYCSGTGSTKLSACIPATVAGGLLLRSKVDEHTLLNWSTAREDDLKEFLVEWSATGGSKNDWMAIGAVQARGNKSLGKDYTFTHTPTVNTNYYRLREESNDGQYEYSHSLRISFDGSADEPMVFPNPVEGMMNVTHLEAGSRLSLYSPDGMLLWRGNAVNATEQVDMSRYQAGIYLFTILKADGRSVLNYRIVKK